MDKYSVKLSPRALRDLDGIYSYIARTLLEPETASGSEAVSETGGLEQAAEVEESAANGYSVHTAAASHALICPGHIDLKISATIRTLNENSNLYSVDDTGNTVGETESEIINVTGMLASFISEM